MYIPDELKLNKFRECSIPSNRDYFVRFGFADVPENQYTGDENAPHPMNKVDSIVDYQNYAEMMAEQGPNDNYSKSEK